MRHELVTAAVVVALLVSGAGGAVAADAPADAGTERLSIPDDGVDPRPTNDSAGEYRPIEPSQDFTDKPVRLETLPDEVSNGSASASAGAASSDSIVMDPGDDGSDHPFVGTTKQYLGSDQGSYYFKPYTLVAVSDEMEVWVADNLSWPADDPRADPVITEAQAESMARQFDENMYPVETETFGQPDARNGTESLLEQLGTVPDDYYATGADDDSNRSVLLVDNVRDQNYYDPDYPLYIAGFYSPTIQTYTDRNVITVDAYDWAEVNETNRRTGYEGTLAHEYQHLIHADLDGDETTWVNEGMSDYAEVITGYGVPQGHLSAYEAMPSNSLVNWEDQGAINVLADYGVAFAWTMYLEDQYDREFVSNLASDDENGVESVENTLEETGADRDFYELYQDFSTAVVTDQLGEARKDEYTFGNLDVSVNTSNGVETAGVWGADYRTVDTADRGPISGVTVSGTEFVDTQWSTATDPVTEEGQVLYSGSGNLLDRHAIVEVDLSDAQDPTLEFDSYQRIEQNWDYGFVQVSTDGGETWHSLANENTDASPSSSAHPRVAANVPGLTGDTDGWQHQTFDLGAYAGNDSVLVSLRYVTDWAFVKDGWYVRNVSVAGESVPTDTAEPYMSEREATDDYVEYQFTFVGVKSNGNYRVHQLDMRTFDESDRQELQRFLRNGNFEEVVVASTWAAGSGGSGRVPVDVELDFVREGERGNGNGNG